MSVTFRVVCFTCKQTVDDLAKATIHIPLADVTAHQQAMTRYRQDHGATGEYTAPPEPIRWRVDCDTCNPHRNGRGVMCDDCYWFDASRCHTWTELVDWTAHLAGKTWLPSTDWYEFIRAIADGTNDVGLIADR